MFFLLAGLVRGQSVQREPATGQDTVASAKVQFEPDPTVAALLSAAIPGAGQIYARKWWHAPIFIAGEAYCLWRAYEFGHQADSLWDLRSQLDPEGEQYAAVGEQFSNAAQNRNSFLWLFAGAKFLDIVDAYVCAHLYNFEEKVNVPLEVKLEPAAEGFKFALTIKF